jgi:hypothetical protein
MTYHHETLFEVYDPRTGRAVYATRRRWLAALVAWWRGLVCVRQRQVSAEDAPTWVWERPRPAEQVRSSADDDDEHIPRYLWEEDR